MKCPECGRYTSRDPIVAAREAIEAEEFDRKVQEEKERLLALRKRKFPRIKVNIEWR